MEAKLEKKRRKTDDLTVFWIHLPSLRMCKRLKRDPKTIFLLRVKPEDLENGVSNTRRFLICFRSPLILFRNECGPEDDSRTFGRR